MEVRETDRSVGRLCLTDSPNLQGKQKTFPSHCVSTSIPQPHTHAGLRGSQHSVTDMWPRVLAALPGQSAVQRIKKLSELTNTKGIPLIRSNDSGSGAERPAFSPEELGNERWFPTWIFLTHHARCMQNVLDLALALKVAPSTAVVAKKHLELTTNRLQAHIREELYDTMEPKPITLPAWF